MLWRCREYSFDLDERALVMGVVNVTPDSFSDGGRFLDPLNAAAEIRRHIAAGADLIDIGAESTRPGSQPVRAADQLKRLEPVLEAIAGEGICISIDTASAEVAKRALAGGANVINDVTAAADPEMAAVVASAGAGLVLMHMQGRPETMQDDPRYDDTAQEVREWLEQRLEAVRGAGIAPEAVALDPGIGFGKTVRHNLELLSRLEELSALGRPIVVGVSRKGFIGRILDLPVDQRLEGSLSAAAVAVFQGARVIRTHDVAPTVIAVKVAGELRAARRVAEGRAASS